MRPGQKAQQVINLSLFLTALGAGLLLARHNLRQGRGDQRGAARVAGFIFALGLLAFICTATHVPTAEELPVMIMGVGLNLFQAGLFWIVYIALEPFVRRRWPHAIVSWTRLLSGRINDPLVGRDVLIGCLIGVLTAVIVQTSAIVEANPVPPANLDTLESFGNLLANYLSDFSSGIVSAFVIFLVLFLFRLVLRKEWIAAAVFVAVFAGAAAAGSQQPFINFVFAVLVLSLLVLALLRFGFVTMAIAAFVSNSLPFIPMTLDTSHWAAAAGFAPFIVVAALAASAFRAALGGRRLLRDELLG